MPRRKGVGVGGVTLCYSQLFTTIQHTRPVLEPGFESPFATVSKLGHFRSLHDASVHSAV